jgi:hypothetical protein
MGPYIVPLRACLKKKVINILFRGAAFFQEKARFSLAFAF